MIDLHTHSCISDGELSPAELLKIAAKQGLCAIALTDHDTLNGLDEAKTASLAEKIKFIPGIEININWTGRKDVPGLGPGGEFHLLGLGINAPSRSFIDAINDLARKREIRNLAIMDRMYELNIISEAEFKRETIKEELMAFTGRTHSNETGGKMGDYSLGRPHFAAFLIKNRIVKDINQAFDRYLGVGKPLYVSREGLNFDEAVVLIHESGGIPVLAHPISLYVSWGRLPDLVKALKDRGLAGLEAWHPTTKAGSCQRLESLAKSLGLYVTEGSDFHGSIRPERRLGYSNKGRKIDDSVLETIPELMTND